MFMRCLNLYLAESLSTVGKPEAYDGVHPCTHAMSIGLFKKYCSLPQLVEAAQGTYVRTYSKNVHYFLQCFLSHFIAAHIMLWKQ